MYYSSDTCRTIAGRPASGGDSQGGSTPQDNSNLMRTDVNTLVLAPNPASVHTTVQYRFAKGSTRCSIELVDIAGRRLQTFDVEAEAGELNLPMEQFAAGIYQIVMRRDNIVVKQTKLSLTR